MAIQKVKPPKILVQTVLANSAKHISKTMVPAPVVKSNTELISNTLQEKKTRIFNRIDRGKAVSDFLSDRIDFLDRMVKHFSEGLSTIEVCMQMGMNYKTFGEMLVAYPDFREAAEEGIMRSYSWWIREGRGNIGNIRFNVSLWMKMMTNQFGWSNDPAKREDPYNALNTDKIIATSDASNQAEIIGKEEEAERNRAILALYHKVANQASGEVDNGPKSE